MPEVAVIDASPLILLARIDLPSPTSAAILDDKEARRCAEALDVPAFGTLGVVVRARRAGSITSAREVIKKLVAARIRASSGVIEEALRRVGE